MITNVLSDFNLEKDNMDFITFIIKHKTIVNMAKYLM